MVISTIQDWLIRKQAGQSNRTVGPERVPIHIGDLYSVDGT